MTLKGAKNPVLPNDPLRLADENDHIAKRGKIYTSPGTSISISQRKPSIESYPPDYDFPSPGPKQLPAAIEIIRETTAEAILDLAWKSHGLCALVSANPSGPCTADLGGINSQEFSLYAFTTLRHLQAKDPRFAYGRTTAPLFTDAMTFYGSVPFFRNLNGTFFSAVRSVNFLCCTPPLSDGTVEDSALIATLENRIRKILQCMRTRGMQTLILGAFGCGSFSNDPRMVARAFLKILIGEEYRCFFKRIIFAVPGSSFKVFMREHNNVIFRSKQFVLAGEVIEVPRRRELLFGIVGPNERLRGGLQRTARCENKKGATGEAVMDAYERLMLEGHSNVGAVCFANPQNESGGAEVDERDAEFDICCRSGLWAVRDGKREEIDRVVLEEWNRRGEGVAVEAPNVMMLAEIPVFRDREYRLRRDPFYVKVVVVNPPVIERNTGLEMLRQKICRLLDLLVDEELTSAVVGVFDCRKTGREPEEVAAAFRDCLSDARYEGYFRKIVFCVTNEKEKAGFEAVLGNPGQ